MVCPGCGQANPPAQKFCGECGGSLTAAGPAPTPAPGLAPRFTAPDTYTPRHLAERILTSKASLEGERKQVTVLFADLKGSMELLADRDPEEARKLLDPVLEHMMEAVHRFEGTVNQVMGDGIMALFGAPLAHEDHAVRACYAALRMQESVKRYAEGIFRTYGVPVRIRVGLNSGEVVVRSIGSDLHMDYTAVGQTTHLAARMEQIADPGSILMAPATVLLAEGYVQLTSRGPVAVKGLAEPVEVCELTGVSATRSRLQAAATRGLSRFVGRDAEMEALHRALDHAKQGRGQVVAIVGDPGVGKSRLVFELTHSHRVAGWTVLEAGSVSYGKATSYLPVIDLLKGYFKIHDRDTHRDIREKVTGKLLTLDEGLRPILSPLLGLLDVPVEDQQWTALDPQQRRQRTLDGVKRLVLREAQVQPLLVVFEDLHWIDSETQALLEILVDSLPASRLLLLVNYRPEYSHGWGSKTYYTQLRLDALPAETAEELLESLLGQDASVQPLKPLLAARTGGNPLFLEESVRGLVETHALAGERGAYRLTHPVEAIQVPATVQAILAARIDRLPPEGKALLQAAAVIGKDVPFALLKEIAETPEDRLRQGLAHLQAAEFVYETSLFPDLEYTFKHALTHEVAYGSVLQERRKALHARIVTAIERLYADRLDEQVEQLAHHAVRAELWERAAVHGERAGARAMARHAYVSATAHFEQALAAVTHLGDDARALALAIDLRLQLRAVLHARGDVARVSEVMTEALALARKLGDPQLLARALSGSATSLYLAGQPAKAAQLGREAVALLGDIVDMDPRAAVVIRHVLSQCLLSLGDLVETRRHLEHNVMLFRNGLHIESSHWAARVPAFSRVWLSWCLSEQGEFDTASDVAAEVTRITEGNPDPYVAGGRAWAIGLSRAACGHYQAAAEVVAPALDACKAGGVHTWIPPLGALLGYAQALHGRVVEGVALLQEAVARGPRENDVTTALAYVWLGEALLVAGRLHEAAAVTRRALELSRQRQERGQEARALRCLGELEMRRGGDASVALSRHRDALAIANQTSMRPLVAHCHAGLAKLYRRTARSEQEHDQAQEHLALATTMYREMGMTYWLEKLEAGMRSLPS
jgi:class 3 adenylate cyclase